MIRIEHLRKAYPEATPLRDVCVTIEKGDAIAVIGPSGTGKSTLLRCINMLEKPTAGKIFVDEEEITAKGYPVHQVRRRLGMVFQSFNLFPQMTVIENVMQAPIDLLRRSRQEAYDCGMALLRQVGLADKALQYPGQLSGGQKQRVAIARTLAMDPEIILFDEPTSALDPTMVGEVETVIRDLARAGTTMMIVTHEMKFAREVANRVFYLDEGGIYEEGTPEEIFDHPRREKTRRFIRRAKVLEMTFRAKDFDFPGATAQIEEYGFRNTISRRAVYRIHTVLEETCMQLLLPRLPADTMLRVAVEYTEADDAVRVSLLYGGPAADPRADGDTLSLLLLQGVAARAEYRPLTEGEYTNRLDFLIR